MLGSGSIEFEVKIPTSGNVGQKWGTRRFTSSIDG